MHLHRPSRPPKNLIKKGSCPLFVTQFRLCCGRIVILDCVVEREQTSSSGSLAVSQATQCLSCHIDSISPAPPLLPPIALNPTNSQVNGWSNGRDTGPRDRWTQSHHTAIKPADQAWSAWPLRAEAEWMDACLHPQTPLIRSEGRGGPSRGIYRQSFSLLLLVVMPERSKTGWMTDHISGKSTQNHAGIRIRPHAAPNSSRTPS